jgi:hypothetical protein
MKDTVDLLLKKFVNKAISEYNKLRSPEATARLLKIHGCKVSIIFEGPFCTTCGINDWVEDMKYVMEDLGAEADLVEIFEPDEFLPSEEWRIGVFLVKRLSVQYRRQQEVRVGEG